MRFDMFSPNLVTFISIAITAVQSLPQTGGFTSCTSNFDGPLLLSYELFVPGDVSLSE